MKRAILLLWMVFALGTMAAQNVDTHKSKAGVTKISQNQFKKSIFDYGDTAAMYQGKLPVIVDFYADWCGPCRKLAPVMEELSGEYAGKVVFYKINVDENRELAQLFGIHNIPTMLFIRPNERPQKAVGGLSKAQLREIIETYFFPSVSE